MNKQFLVRWTGQARENIDSKLLSGCMSHANLIADNDSLEKEYKVTYDDFRKLYVFDDNKYTITEQQIYSKRFDNGLPEQFKHYIDGCWAVCLKNHETNGKTEVLEHYKIYQLFNISLNPKNQVTTGVVGSKYRWNINRFRVVNVSELQKLQQTELSLPKTKDDVVLITEAELNIINLELDNIIPQEYLLYYLSITKQVWESLNFSNEQVYKISKMVNKVNKLFGEEGKFWFQTPYPYEQLSSYTPRELILCKKLKNLKLIIKYSLNRNKG